MLTLHESPRRGGTSCPSPESTVGPAPRLSADAGSLAATGDAGPSASSAEVARRLAVLLDEAGTRHLDDQDSWRRIAADARVIVGRLVEFGVAPAHLEIRDGEPAVVVRRTIAAAWRYASGAVAVE